MDFETQIYIYDVDATETETGGEEEEDEIKTQLVVAEEDPASIRPHIVSSATENSETQYMYSLTDATMSPSSDESEYEAEVEVDNQVNATDTNRAVEETHSSIRTGIDREGEYKYDDDECSVEIHLSREDDDTAADTAVQSPEVSIPRTIPSSSGSKEPHRRQLQRPAAQAAEEDSQLARDLAASPSLTVDRDPAVHADNICGTEAEHTPSEIEGTFHEDNEEEKYPVVKTMLAETCPEPARSSSTEIHASDELRRIDLPTAKTRALSVPDIDVDASLNPNTPSEMVQTETHAREAAVEKSSDQAVQSSEDDDDDDELRIAFSGIEPCKALVKKLNSALARNKMSQEGPRRARSVSDIKIATHLVLESVSMMKRTTKLLIALNCENIKSIVGLEWLEDSITAACALPVDRVLSGSTVAPSSRGYLVHDADKELQWGFNLQTVLTLPKRGIFSNCSVFVMPGVCGVCAPPLTKFKDIIATGNGHWIEELPTASKMSVKWFEQQASNAQELAKAEGSYRIICISQPDKMPKTLPASIKKLLSGPMECGVWCAETILLGCLRQDLDLSEGIIIAPVDKTSPGKKFHLSGEISKKSVKRRNPEPADSTKKAKRR